MPQIDRIGCVVITHRFVVEFSAPLRCLDMCLIDVEPLLSHEPYITGRCRVTNSTKLVNPPHLPLLVLVVVTRSDFIQPILVAHRLHDK